ncbi:hypothetical protein [Novosphingobium sp.]|uniref:hypothetical protein n=1 Tax=Novosphingobium sp. TaxID=1874826 RepID=UPI003D1364BF
MTPYAPRWRFFAGIALTMALAACAGKPLPPPPPPPPPLIEVPPPPEPIPPDGAAPTLVTPEIGADGQRESVNRKVSSNQIVWNLRSAYTVAALGCLDPRNAAILPNYRAFLARNANALKTIYDAMDHEFRAKYQRGGEKLRDDYLTVLYNHYALPPTKDAFCNVVDQVMQAGVNVPPAQLDVFATANVPLIEKVFDDFYTRYDQYKNALAAWQEKYGRVGHVTIGRFVSQAPPPPTPPSPLMPTAPLIQTAPYHNQVETTPGYPAPAYQAPGYQPAPAAPAPVYQPPVPGVVQAPVRNTAQPLPQPVSSGRLPDLLSGPRDEPVSTPAARPVAGPPNQ